MRRDGVTPVTLATRRSQVKNGTSQHALGTYRCQSKESPASAEEDEEVTLPRSTCTASLVPCAGAGASPGVEPAGPAYFFQSYPPEAPAPAGDPDPTPVSHHQAQRIRDQQKHRCRLLSSPPEGAGWASPGVDPAGPAYFFQSAPPGLSAGGDEAVLLLSVLGLVEAAPPGGGACASPGEEPAGPAYFFQSKPEPPDVSAAEDEDEEGEDEALDTSGSTAMLVPPVDPPWAPMYCL
jgi:hypothetical protein